MQAADFYVEAQKHFPHTPTHEQDVLLRKLSNFCTNAIPANLFLLKGYAGTGKTTMIRSLVKTLPAAKLKSVLLAPTGRAAKVAANYSGKQAFTIHKKIYKRITDENGFSFFIKQTNLHTHTLFIVDEASMIGNGGGLGSNSSLLNDLISYVFSGISCKLLLIGDTAQLPPVGLDSSPALDLENLKSLYNIDIAYHQLKMVMRQAAESGILNNATHIRENITQATDLKFNLTNFKDVVRINGEELEDALNSAHGKYGAEGVTIICRSNKRSYLFNQQVRMRIRWLEDEVAAGDLMMVVKNNYAWLTEQHSAGFIANGDSIELLKIGNLENKYGFRFVDAHIRMIDYPNDPPMEVKLLLDTIATEAPALSQEEHKKLYQQVAESYINITDKNIRYKKIKEDPYLNALQVKFCYAITCHKAQGGQWPAVFVDQGYLTDEMLNTEYMRWLYTAITRATEKLYLVNFNDKFFND